jgi:hypothetical protein
MKKSNKGAAKLKKIVAKAQKIYRSKSGKNWIACIKQAAKSV